MVAVTYIFRVLSMVGAGFGDGHFSLPTASRTWASSAAAGALLLAWCASAQGQQVSRPTGIDPRQAEKQIDAIQLDRRRAKQQSVALPPVSGQTAEGGQVRPFPLH